MVDQDKQRRTVLPSGLATGTAPTTGRFKVATGPYVKDKRFHEEIYLRRGESTTWSVPSPHKLKVAKIVLKESIPAGAPRYPFPKKKKQLETFRGTQVSGPAEGKPLYRGKAEYKATYELKNGETWDPHIIIDW